VKSGLHKWEHGNKRSTVAQLASQAASWQSSLPVMSAPL
jgi:hypothetical protein